MTIDNGWEQSAAEKFHPTFGVRFGAGEAERAFARESHTSCLSTGCATIQGETHFVGVAAIKHLVDDLVIVWRVVTWSGGFESVPMIMEDLLEGLFVNVRARSLHWMGMISRGTAEEKSRAS